MKTYKLETKVLHKHNPNLKRKIVNTIDDSFEYRINCVKINNSYYRKNDQAIFLENKWYSLTSDFVFYNHEIKDYDLKTRGKRILSGIINTNLEKGQFTQNAFYNCRITVGNETFNCISYEIPKSLGYEESLNTEEWRNDFNKSKFTKNVDYLPNSVRKRLKNRFVSNDIQIIKFADNAYNYGDSISHIETLYNYNSFNTIIYPGVKKAATLLKDIKFGYEIETSAGSIPNYLMNQLGVVICKDGSINYTPEFVSVPQTGAKGLQSLINLSEELGKRCKTSEFCSIHYHFSNIPKDREYIIALYRLFELVQSDIYDMLPAYKRDVRLIGKDKDYCSPLRNIFRFRSKYESKKDYKDTVNNAYYSIYRWLLEDAGSCKDYNKKNKQHPKGKNKWNYANRYTVVNLIPLFFSTKETIEIRPHHATLSAVKNVNWLFICNAILKFCELNYGNILKNKKYSLNDVLDYYKTTFKTEYAKNVSEYLKEYVQNRKNYYTKCKENSDAIGMSELNDANFTFSTSVLTNIY